MDSRFIRLGRSSDDDVAAAEFGVEVIPGFEDLLDSVFGVTVGLVSLGEESGPWEDEPDPVA